MKRRKKVERLCEACRGDDEPARFRTLTNLYMCDACFTEWQETGTIPAPKLPAEDEETRRW